MDPQQMAWAAGMDRGQMEAAMRRRSLVRDLEDFTKNNPQAAEQFARRVSPAAGGGVGLASGGASPNPGAQMQSGWDADARLRAQQQRQDQLAAREQGLRDDERLRTSPTVPHEVELQNQRKKRFAETELAYAARHASNLGPGEALKQRLATGGDDGGLTLGVAATGKVGGASSRDTKERNDAIKKYMIAKSAYEALKGHENPAISESALVALEKAKAELGLYSGGIGDTAAPAATAKPAAPGRISYAAGPDGYATDRITLTNAPAEEADPVSAAVADKYAGAFGKMSPGHTPQTFSEDPTATTGTGTTSRFPIAKRTLPDGTVQVKYSDGTIGAGM